MAMVTMVTMDLTYHVPDTLPTMALVTMGTMDLTYHVPDVEQALKHPYMASFYTGKEPKCPGILTVPIDDDHK